MKKFLKIAYMIALCIFLIFCMSSCDTSSEDELYEQYEEGYLEGYADGYEDGYDELSEISYDELEYEKEEKNEVLRLMFESVYKGYEIKDGEVWYAGNLALRFHHKQDGYLHFDVKFTDFDIKTICNGDIHDYMDKFPIVCYVGTYEDGQYIAQKWYFTGENLFMDIFKFTEDGYLTDYCDYYSDCDSLYILVFSNGEVYSAKYNIK